MYPLMSSRQRAGLFQRHPALPPAITPLGPLSPAPAAIPTMSLPPPPQPCPYLPPPMAPRPCHPLFQLHTVSEVSRHLEAGSKRAITVSFQPLEYTLNYHPPDSEVTVEPFFLTIITSSSERNLERVVTDPEAC